MRAKILPLIAWAAAASLAASCTHSSSSGRGTVYSPARFEYEPNDQADTADYLGFVYPGSFTKVQGHVSAGGFDQLDGFSLFVDEPVDLEIVLTAHSHAADLDFSIYDPLADEFVLFFESGDNPEVGWVAAVQPGDELHIVVESFFGDADYTLEITGWSLAGFAALSEDGPGPRFRRSLRAEQPAQAAEARDRSELEAYRRGPAAPDDAPEEPPVLSVRGAVLALDEEGRIVAEGEVLQPLARGAEAAPEQR